MHGVISIVRMTHLEARESKGVFQQFYTAVDRMEEPFEDPVVAEFRAAKEAYAKEFNY